MMPDGGGILAQKNITLNAWQQTPINLHAVQGETESRTLIITGVDASGVPVNLVGATPRIYIEKSDQTKIFADGMLTDAANGKMQFVLGYQALSAPGTAHCTVMITWPDNRTLKFTGLTLDIARNNLEGAAESTSEFPALVVALNRVDSAVAEAEQAVINAQQAVAGAQTAVTNANAAVASANSAVASANSAAAAANTAAATANQAAQDAASLYQMVSPFTGQADYVTNIISGLMTYIFQGSITAAELDTRAITAQDFDALDIGALSFDTSAKTILGVS